MKNILIRLFYGLLFAIPLMLITYAFAQAANKPQAGPANTLDCNQCHQAFVEAWEGGGHGNATNDPAFQLSWEEKGKPEECLECHVTGYDPETETWQADGITCVACHSPVTASHPLAPMSANRSSKLCGDCHTETYFQWQVSAHRDKGLDCAGCHDPHATGLKKADAGTLCSNCHRGRASNFAHTQHSMEGLSCASCHLTRIAANGAEAHAEVDHSFFVSLSACNSCHSYQMHDPVSVHEDQPMPAPEQSMASVESVTVTREPVPVSPIGFTTLSGLVGVAIGIILAPWVERMRRNGKDDEK